MANKLITSEEAAKGILKIMEQVAKEHNVTFEEIFKGLVEQISEHNRFPECF